MAGQNVTTECVKKSAGLFARHFFCRFRSMLSYYGNVGSADLAAVLRVALGVKSNLLTFLKGLEAFSVDSGEMYEYFLASSFVGDETITLLCVKPLNCTVVHFGTSLINLGQSPF